MLNASVNICSIMTAQNPPAGHQRIIPKLSYTDAPAAIEFLCRAFGFRETYRLAMPDGTIGHAELSTGDAVVMLSTVWEEGGLTSPRNLPKLHAQVFCFVDDVDAHFARARDEGAIIIGEPVDEPYGDRAYRATDLEGHRWVFKQHQRDVSAEEIAAMMSK